MSFDVNPVKSTACEMILGCTESSGVTIVVAAALVVGAIVVGATVVVVVVAVWPETMVTTGSSAVKEIVFKATPILEASSCLSASVKLVDFILYTIFMAVNSLSAVAKYDTRTLEANNDLLRPCASVMFVILTWLELTPNEVAILCRIFDRFPSAWDSVMPVKSRFWEITLALFESKVGGM